jgi:hypothetical protein
MRTLERPPQTQHRLGGDRDRPIVVLELREHRAGLEAFEQGRS